MALTGSIISGTATNPSSSVVTFQVKDSSGQAMTVALTLLFTVGQ